MSITYGYIRVSSAEQNEDRQRIAMKEFGITDKNMILDKQSGKDFLRPGYQRLLKLLHPGDVLVIKSIDRLGRNYNDILEQWRGITKERKAAIVVLDMPLLDTRTDRDLTSALISDIVLQLLSYVAQTEREFIHQRQAEGIAAARLRGVHLGRKALPIPAGFPLIYDQWKQNCITSAQASKQMGLTMNQFIWMRKKYENCSKYAENPFRAGI